MTSIKLKFRPSSVTGAEGTLYYQLIHERRVKQLSTDFHIYPQEWDEETGELALVSTSNDRRTELERIKYNTHWALEQKDAVLAETERLHPNFTINDLAEVFAKVSKQKTVFMFLQEQVARKKQMKRLGTANNYSNAYSHFRAFRQGVDLDFDKLTAQLMEQYEAWLIGRRLKQNSIICYLRTLNTLIHKSVDEGLLSANNLFGRVHLSYVKTIKRAISEEKLRAIIRLKLPQGSIQAFARDIFLFSFYTRGMSFVDIAFLRKKDIKNKQLTYCRRKTNQCLKIGWESKQQTIVDRYASQTADSPFLFPIIQVEDGTEYRQYQRVHVNVNRALKRIGQRVGLQIPLTTYVARHTWATIAQDIGISVAVISDGMGHSSLKTTQIYLGTIDDSKIDEANRLIMDRISQGL